MSKKKRNKGTKRINNEWFGNEMLMNVGVSDDDDGINDGLLKADDDYDKLIGSPGLQ